MKAKPLPPLEALKEYLDYNPDTGILTWKKSHNLSKLGQEAGAICKGYRRITYHHTAYMAHRFAYYMHHGIDPLEKQIDHIDGDRTNNKINNLRLATGSENQMNAKLRKNNISGTTGVYWNNLKNKWEAQIKLNIGKKYLGCFTDKEDAIQARIEAEKKYFGEFRYGL